MNKKSLSIPGVAIGFGLILVMIAWGIGSYYQRGVFIGPYEIGAGRMPIYLELPVVASIDTDKDNMPWKLPFLEIGDYHQVAVYNIDLISFDETSRKKDDPESGSSIQWLLPSELILKMKEQRTRLGREDVDESKILEGLIR